MAVWLIFMVALLIIGIPAQLHQRILVLTFIRVGMMELFQHQVTCWEAWRHVCLTVWPFASDGALYVTEDYYHIIRKVTGTGLVPLPHPPNAPTGLLVTTNSGQITLIWSQSAGATNYIVKRSTSTGGPYTTIGNTATTSFTDTTAVPGTTYYYVNFCYKRGWSKWKFFGSECFATDSTAAFAENWLVRL